MGRAPCCEKVGLKRGRWTAEEDEILRNYIEANGEGSWRSLPKNAGLLRCGKSCRLRWINYLRSDLKRGNITAAEEEIIINLHASLGNRWSVISGYLPGRTDNEIKNYWNSHLSRRIHSFIRRPDPNFTLPPEPAPRLAKSKNAKKTKLDKTAAAPESNVIVPASDGPRGVEMDSIMEELSGIWPETDGGDIGGTSSETAVENPWLWDDVSWDGLTGGGCWEEEVNTLPWSWGDGGDDQNRVSSSSCFQVDPHGNHNAFISWLFS